MKKESEHNETHPQENQVTEPALEYQSILTSHKEDPIDPPAIEKMREHVRCGMNQIREGKYYTTDELDDFVLS